MRSFLFLFTVSAIVTFSHEFLNRKISTSSYRLPTNSIPYHYKIHLNPLMNPDNFILHGRIEIFLKIEEVSKNLTLHASNLTIYEEETTLSGKEETFAPDEHFIDNNRDFLVLKFSKELPPGNYSLKIKFSGMIKDYDHGLFWNSYKNDKNETKYLISTLFQATYAREAFPCWDEPALKATFEISIKHFLNYTALSNMPVEKVRNDEENDGKVWTDFKTTPLMSTYLVAFLVSDFNNYTNSDDNLTVWSKENPSNTMDMVFKTVPKAIKFLENHTNIKSEFPKQDHAAIPRVVEAIENWGLVTYKEEDVYQEKKFSTKKLVEGTLLVIHELCHQWFGNLVTPKWWKHIWLSEGFAQYTQYIVAAELLHEPRMIEYFVATNKYEAFQMEANSSVLALTPEVETPGEIELAFGGLPYTKGASIIHMIRNIISNEVFDTGVRKYLQRHKFKSVSTDDLWESLTEALVEAKLPFSDLNLKEKMDPYLQQRGYPEVNVTRDYDSGKVTLTQECIVCKKYNKDASSDNTKWWIPINFVTNSSLNFSSTLPTHWMNPEEKELIIEGIDPNDWIIINIQNTGYYRVNYDAKNWKKICDYLDSMNYSKIHVLNRVQLFNDFYTPNKINEVSMMDYLSLFFYLRQEVDYLPWIFGLQALNKWFKRVNNYFRLYSMQTIMQTLGIYSVLENLGYEEKDSDDIFTLLRRAEGLKFLCELRNDRCQNKAKDHVLNVLTNSNTDSVPSNYKDWILCAGMRQSDESIWNSMLDVYKKTKDENVLESLSCPENKKILTKYLDLITEDDLISENKVLDVISFAFKTNGNLTLNYVTTNYNEIKQKLRSGESISNLYEHLINFSPTIMDLNNIEKFLKENVDNQTIETMKPLISMAKQKILQT